MEASGKSVAEHNVCFTGLTNFQGFGEVLFTTGGKDVCCAVSGNARASGSCSGGDFSAAVASVNRTSCY